MSVCTCIDEGEPDFNGHHLECPRRLQNKPMELHQIGLLVGRTKQDTERAEAVLESLWRAIPVRMIAEGEILSLRHLLYDQTGFMVDVFKAVRGDDSV